MPSTPQPLRRASAGPRESRAPGSPLQREGLPVSQVSQPEHSIPHTIQTLGRRERLLCVAVPCPAPPRVTPATPPSHPRARGAPSGLQPGLLLPPALEVPGAVGGPSARPPALTCRPVSFALHLLQGFHSQSPNPGGTTLVTSRSPAGAGTHAPSADPPRAGGGPAQRPFPTCSFASLYHDLEDNWTFFGT